MKPLKDTLTNKGIFRELADDLKKAYPQLEANQFYREAVKGLDQLELVARIKRAANLCHQFLPADYSKAIEVLYRFSKGKDNRFIYLFLPTFVAEYGQHDYNRSIKALRDFTQYSSSEDGIRTYLKRDLNRTLAEMLRWTKFKNLHIRRLASEGCRPRLPWAKKVQPLIENPQLTWSILEALRQDPEKYVQKSVANHINDISKDHADWVVARVKKWDRSKLSTKWIVKHGMRTLIKQGHKGALQLFGYHQAPKVALENVKWDQTVRLGDMWQLSLDLVSSSARSQSFVIDYQIHFCKKSGKRNPKIFKLKTCTLKSKERMLLKMKYLFKNRTTRKHYPGEHVCQLMINGKSMKQFLFQLC